MSVYGRSADVEQARQHRAIVLGIAAAANVIAVTKRQTRRLSAVYRQGGPRASYMTHPLSPALPKLAALAREKSNAVNHSCLAEIAQRARRPPPLSFDHRTATAS
jgi:hypothetical protein